MKKIIKNITVKLKRGKPISEVLNTKLKTFSFTGEWLEAFGEPATTGVWFIWGNSGNGKTDFAYQLCKYLTKFGKVAYNSLEEGEISLPMQRSFKRIRMDEVKGKMIMLCETVQQLEARLMQRKSPDIVVIDSVQYSQLSYAHYVKLKEKFRNKLLIFISHAIGKYPTGTVAEKIMFDAYLKIWVEGYRAFSKGRSIGTKGYFTVWQEGSIKYRGE